MTNPKSEVRSPKETRSSKSETGQWNTRSVLECGSPLPLLKTTNLGCPSQSARGLAHSKTWRTFALFFCFLLSAFCFGASGQPYSLDWSTIDAGGGTSTGGVYTVSGTIGQPEAGPPAHAGSYTLQGGFWGVIAAVQTPGAPLLTINLNAQHSTVTVSWPLPAEGWVLQATNALPPVAAPWPQVPPPYQTNGPNLQVVEPLPGGNKFYRLHKP